MSNNQAQDAYNPNRIGSEFEKHLFEESIPQIKPI